MTNGNALYDSLSTLVHERLCARTRPVSAEEPLFDPRARPVDAYFPHGNTVVSLLRGDGNGAEVEVAMIGSNGFLGFDALLSPTSAFDLAVVQTPGVVSCVNAARLYSEFASDVRTRTLLLAYGALFVDEITQAVVCNRMHSIEQRLARWLLMLSEHSGSREIGISHEIIGRMLGIRRVGATLAIGALSREGLIAHTRRHIVVCDPQRLRKHACDCVNVSLRRNKERAARTDVAVAVRSDRERAEC